MFTGQAVAAAEEAFFFQETRLESRISRQVTNELHLLLLFLLVILEFCTLYPNKRILVRAGPLAGCLFRRHR